MRTVSIVGAGRLGCALALALDGAGYKVENLIFRSSHPPESVIQALSSPVLVSDSISELSAEIIFITVQDTEIAPVVSELRAKIAKGNILHTSGSLSSVILGPLRSSSISVGAMHPLVSVSEPHAGAAKFDGAYFCLEGDALAVDAAALIVKNLAGRSFTIDPGSKPLYHASAVLASGHLIALIDTAAELLAKTGLENEDAKEVLMPLVQSTISNLEKQASSEALTGTFARLDGPAFRRHLNSLETSANDNEINIYLELALKSLEIVMRRTGETREAKKFMSEVSMAKSKSRVIK
jgi:predicted short-subunit dehydrogenase-like oxidoreductase (DUF2520 family)